jgi:hypothetical protein
MTADDGQADQSLAAIAALSTYDVSHRQTAQLRAECHAVLQTQSGRKVDPGSEGGTLFRRVIGPALAGAWCLAYLAEIIRRAAALYGF